MRTRGRISVLGLYEWDNTVLEGIVPPSGSIDAAIVHNSILMECAELEVVYPDPEFFKRAVIMWGASRSHAWNRMWRALSEDYNPLHNFDRHEDITVSHSREGDSSDSATEKIEKGTADSRTINSTNENSVAAYNEAGYKPRDKMTGTGTDTVSYSGEDIVTRDNDTTYTDSGSETTVGHLYGNIGITQSADMLRSEMRIRAEYDITSVIVQEFKERFCIMVY